MSLKHLIIDIAIGQLIFWSIVLLTSNGWLGLGVALIANYWKYLGFKEGLE